MTTESQDPGKSAPPLTERSRSRQPPTTARGERSRAALVSAARTVFERDGFVNSRLIDITSEAGCAIGTFYVYFTDKDDIFAAVLAEVQDDMLHPGLPDVVSDTDPVRVIAASNRAYLEAYRRNARLMELLDQVAATDSAFASLRRQRTAAFAQRNARSIADLQERGLADRDLDPQITALALSGMVSRLAHHGFIGGEEFSVDELAATATRLWVNALALTTAPS